jgi:hypothetical protein
MTEGQYQARVVCDSTGNLWRWYGDVGYVLLVTTSREQCAAASTLAELEARVGPVSEWVSAAARDAVIEQIRALAEEWPTTDSLTLRIQRILSALPSTGETNHGL